MKRRAVFVSLKGALVVGKSMLGPTPDYDLDDAMRKGATIVGTPIQIGDTRVVLMIIDEDAGQDSQGVTTRSPV